MGLGFWNKLKEFGKKVWGGVTSVFNKIIKPVAQGPIGGLVQSLTHIPVQQIVHGIDSGISAINNFSHAHGGTNASNVAHRRMLPYEKYRRGGIDAVLNKPDG
jgi:hypothetical protein